MNDLLDIRIGRACAHVSTRRVRFAWNRIPTLLHDFGWLFLWVRGLDVIYMHKNTTRTKTVKRL